MPWFVERNYDMKSVFKKISERRAENVQRSTEFHDILKFIMGSCFTIYMHNTVAQYIFIQEEK